MGRCLGTAGTQCTRVLGRRRAPFLLPVTVYGQFTYLSRVEDVVVEMILGTEVKDPTELSLKNKTVNSWLKVFQAWPDPGVEIMTLGFRYFYSFLCSACLWLYFQCEQRQTSVSEKPLVLDAVRGLGRESTCPRQLEPRPRGALRSPGLARGLTRDRVSAPGMPRVTGWGGGWSAQ